jgi:uncharacterized membrane protein YphA (DoxX/SURF4 family)
VPYKFPDAAARLLYLRVAVAVSTLAGMAFTHKLWLTARFYPLTPVLPFLRIPPPFDTILFGATLAALAASVLTPRLIPIFATLAIVLVLFDQSRLQPWFFLCFFLLLGVAFAAPNACRLMVASLWFWSGVEQINAGYLKDVFPAMLARHLTGAIVPALAVAIPVLELAIGLALLTKKLRPIALAAAVTVSAVILFATHEPWNLAMAVFLVLLFYKSTESVDTILTGDGPFHIAILLLFAVAPVLSFFGLWEIYAGSTNRGTIYIEDADLSRLPAEIARYAHKEKQGVDSIGLAEWSAAELNVPPRPDIRVFRSIARSLCGYAEVRLSIVTKSPIGSRITGSSSTCVALKNH